MRYCGIRGVIRHHLAWLVLILCSWQVAAARAQQAPKTDPVEAAALNTILGRWGKKASPEWNISGQLCSGFATDKTDWDYYPQHQPVHQVRLHGQQQHPLPHYQTEGN
uniref:Uncharacterized protein n=1 Tax=Oryza glumipatula TaxID=40148 RepID=A0A0D9ZWF3_9ORYZ